MNKREALKRIEVQKETLIRLTGWAVYVYIEELIKSLDEPEKVKAPQFIAEFITEQKKLGHTLSYSIDASMSDRVAEWYWDNSELFARAWLDGYEVEEEKRYLVKVKGVSGYGRYLNKALSSNEYFFASNNEIKSYRTKFTRKELEEAGFGWVFDCPGIKIEEVEE